MTINDVAIPLHKQVCIVIRERHFQEGLDPPSIKRLLGGRQMIEVQRYTLLLKVFETRPSRQLRVLRQRSSQGNHDFQRTSASVVRRAYLYHTIDDGVNQMRVCEFLSSLGVKFGEGPIVRLRLRAGREAFLGDHNGEEAGDNQRFGLRMRKVDALINGRSELPQDVGLC